MHSSLVNVLYRPICLVPIITPLIYIVYGVYSSTVQVDSIMVTSLSTDRPQKNHGLTLLSSEVSGLVQTPRPFY